MPSAARANEKAPFAAAPAGAAAVRGTHDRDSHAVDQQAVEIHRANGARSSGANLILTQFKFCSKPRVFVCLLPPEVLERRGAQLRVARRVLDRPMAEPVLL
jgi:hypothetical protein